MPSDKFWEETWDEYRRGPPLVSIPRSDREEEGFYPCADCGRSRCDHNPDNDLCVECEGRIARGIAARDLAALSLWDRFTHPAKALRLSKAAKDPTHAD